jgi:hypothetical protein
MDKPSDNDVKLPDPVAAPVPDAATSPAPAPTESQPKSEPDASGRQPAAPAPTPEPEAGKSKSEVTSYRAPGAERRISELTAKNKELRQKLAATLGAPTSGAPAPVKDEDKPEYWLQKYNTAQTEQERQQASAKWFEADRNQFASQIESRVMQKLSLQQKAGILTDKLIRVHERAPFLKETGAGVEIDIDSPVTQRAKQLAAEEGINLMLPDGKLNLGAFLYCVQGAALETQDSTAENAQAALEQQRVATLRVASKTAGLESSSAAAPAQPSGPKVDLEKQIANLEQQRKTSGFSPDLNAQIKALRMKLRDASLAKK